MKRVIFFLAICIATNQLFAQGPINQSPFASKEEILLLKQFTYEISNCSMKGAKLKSTKIKSFDFDAGMEFAHVKSFRVEGKKLYQDFKSYSRVSFNGFSFMPKQFGVYYVLVLQQEEFKNRMVKIVVSKSGYDMTLYGKKRKVTRINFVESESEEKLKVSELPDFEKSSFGRVKWNEFIEKDVNSKVAIQKYFKNEGSVILRTGYQFDRNSKLQQLFNSPCATIESVNQIFANRGIYWIQVTGIQGTYFHRTIVSNNRITEADLFVKD